MADKSRVNDPFAPMDLDVFTADSDPFDFLNRDEQLESQRMPADNLKHTQDAKHKTLKALQRKFAMEHIGEIPKPGQSVHIITNARVDFWDFTPALLNLAAPRIALRWYGSTWILNRRNAIELLQLRDEGKIRSAGLITGIYFKRREAAVFATVYEGLRKRGDRFKACLNHSKWIAMVLDDGTGLVCISSANFTENGNIETHCLTNDRAVFDFYADFADDLLDH